MRDSNLCPLAPQASVLPLDHCELNSLQLNPDKSQALVIGTTNQLHATTSPVTTVSVAGVDLPVADELKVSGVVLDKRLSLDSHATSVVRACNYHAWAIRHIRHLLTTDLAVTLACSLILSRLDYCNSVLCGAPAGSIQKLQRVQNTAARITLQDDASGARRATAQTAALATGPSAHPVQASHTDEHDPPYNHTILSEPPHPVSTISSSTSIFF